MEEQLKKGQGTFTLERLKKRCVKDGKVTWEDGKTILIKMQGESLPTRLLVGFGHVWINVKPFVESAKQCFNCFKFAHVQNVCRTIEKKVFRVYTHLTTGNVCRSRFHLHSNCTRQPAFSAWQRNATVYHEHGEGNY